MGIIPGASEEAEFIPVMRNVAGGGDGGVNDDGSRRDLTVKIMEAHVMEIQGKMNLMQKKIEPMKKEIQELKEYEEHKKDTTNDEQEKGQLVKGGGWNDGGGWGKDSEWTWGTDLGREGTNKAGSDERDNKGTRVSWGGGRDDRRNEMVARGFKRNTPWKEIKATVEAVMEASRVTYGWVKVIGQMASFAIIRFEEEENKKAFKL